MTDMEIEHRSADFVEVSVDSDVVISENQNIASKEMKRSLTILLLNSSVKVQEASMHKLLFFKVKVIPVVI